MYLLCIYFKTLIISVLMRLHSPRMPVAQGDVNALAGYSGTAVVDLTRSSTKLVLQSCTLGCLSSVSMMKAL